ncbi:hypothetical protein WUBG_03236 [Wuchereria bancrofti]|nr:hypothetical protein WUBG_03236 [Wuchereria bancrofti]
MKQQMSTRNGSIVNRRSETLKAGGPMEGEKSSKSHNCQPQAACSIASFATILTTNRVPSQEISIHYNLLNINKND